MGSVHFGVRGCLSLRGFVRGRLRVGKCSRGGRVSLRTTTRVLGVSASKVSFRATESSDVIYTCLLRGYCGGRHFRTLVGSMDRPRFFGELGFGTCTVSGLDSPSVSGGRLVFGYPRYRGGTGQMAN